MIDSHIGTLLAAAILACATQTRPTPVPPPAPTPVQPAAQKLKVVSPPILKTDEKIDCKATKELRTTDSKCDRFTVSETKDDIEVIVTTRLSVSEKSDIWYTGEIVFNSVSWQLVCEKHSDGTAVVSIRYTASVHDRVYGLSLDAPPKRGDFKLVYNNGGTPKFTDCTEATSQKSDALSLTTDQVAFLLQPVQILELADAGAFRMKYPEGFKELKMRDADREAFRWFVWTHVPNGEQLLKDRYDLVPREPKR